MKLSEKGWKKAEKYLCPECWKETNWERPNEPEFDTDDFVGGCFQNGKDHMVCMTVEEAIFAVRVLHTVWDSSCISMNQDCYNKIKEINRKLILQVNRAEDK